MTRCFVPHYERIIGTVHPVELYVLSQKWIQLKNTVLKMGNEFFFDPSYGEIIK